MNNPMRIWEQVCTTDPKITKRLEHANRTAIDAYHQIESATQLFGPYGIGFGLDPDSEVWTIHELKNDTVIALLDVTFWYLDPSSGEKGFYRASGGGKVQFVDRYGKFHANDDYRKSARTDALTKALSYLGWNADIFQGKFDDNKYVAQMMREHAEPKPEAKKAAEDKQPAGVNVPRQPECWEEYQRYMEEAARKGGVKYATHILENWRHPNINQDQLQQCRDFAAIAPSALEWRKTTLAAALREGNAKAQS